MAPKPHDIVTDLSMASMVKAVEANLFAFFPLLANWPRAEAHDDPDMIWTLSDAPYPLFNSIVRARFTSAAADDGIKKAIARSAARRVPMLWWTGPQSAPSDLEERLTRHGFYADHSTGMVADLAVRRGERGAFRGHGGFAIDPVLDKTSLTKWCTVLCEGFGAPMEFGHAFGEFAGAVGLESPSPLRHYLGSIDGEAVATVSLFYGAGVAGVYDVSTLPSHRRQGIGAAITRAALDLARDEGYRLAILHSSALGNRVYQSLGFKECCRIGQFVWIP